MQTVFAGECGNAGMFLLLPLQGEPEDSLPLIEAEAASPAGGREGENANGRGLPRRPQLLPSLPVGVPTQGQQLVLLCPQRLWSSNRSVSSSGQGIKVTLESLFQCVDSIASWRAQFSPGEAARKGGTMHLDAGKRSSASCASGPANHPQDVPCLITVQRAKRHRPTGLSVLTREGKGECRAQPPESACQWYPCQWRWVSGWWGARYCRDVGANTTPWGPGSRGEHFFLATGPAGMHRSGGGIPAPQGLHPRVRDTRACV